MPTELTMTTRMLPVRMGAEHGSAVRPVAEVAAEVVAEAAQPFDRRKTAPCLPREERASSSSDAALVRAVIDAAPALPIARLIEAPRMRPAAAVATQDADYAVKGGILPIDEYDHIPELSLHNVTEVNASEPTFRSATNQVAPAYLDEPLPRPQPAAASARPRIPLHNRAATPSDRQALPAPARKRSATPSGRQTPARGEGYDELTQARMQLAQAVETARKSEQRARDAEMLAAWAERYTPRRHASEQHFAQAQREQRLRWLKRALQVSLVGLAVGAYVSLLGPVRERVITQNATIQRLTELQEQLRSEQRELRERIEQERNAQAEEAQPPVREPQRSARTKR